MKDGNDGSKVDIDVLCCNVQETKKRLGKIKFKNWTKKSKCQNVSCVTMMTCHEDLCPIFKKENTTFGK